MITVTFSLGYVRVNIHDNFLATVHSGYIPLRYISSIAFRMIFSSSFFLKDDNVRRTRCVKRGSRLATARSISVTFAFTSCNGVSGTGGFSSSCLDSSGFDLSSAFFISTSAMVSNKNARVSFGDGDAYRRGASVSDE